MSESEDCLLESAKALIESAGRLKLDVEALKDVHGQPLHGSGKLCRKIESEIKFLTKKIESKRLKESYVNCSNLPYLRSVHEAATIFPLVTSILTPFQPQEDIQDQNVPNEEVPILIDAVANEGFLWVKVVARSAEGLMNNWTGNCEMSHRSLEEQLEELLDLADLCPVYFRKPLLAIYFANGVMQQMADEIEDMGVQVFGTVRCDNGECITKTPEDVFKTSYSTQSPTQLNSRLLNQTFLSEYQTLNLDVSTLIAMCSNLTHGHSNWIFDNSKILNMQIKDEVEHSGQLWNELESFTSGKKLVCCQTAFDSYSEILNIVGGPREKQRSAKLFESIEVIPDHTCPTVAGMPVSSSVKDRSKVIFGTGYELQTVTVTSNLSCVRSMRQMGVYFPVYAHVARALTEQKEATGVEVRPGSDLALEQKSLVARNCVCFLCKNLP